MKFGDPGILKLLYLLIPVMLYFVYRLVFIFVNLRKFLDRKTAEKVLYPVSYIQAGVKYALLLFSLVLMLIAAARPLGKPIESEQQLSGIDIMLVLDVSSSMFAVDLQPNRMEAVRQGVKGFISSLEGDRVGMLVFAGVNFVQCPLTTDYEALDLIMDGINAGMMPKEGTALGNAIKDAVDRMEEKAEKSKIMILITDGESLEGMSPIEAAKLAKEKDIRIYTIGVGTEEGGRIPEGQDMFGRMIWKAYRGQVVVSRLEDAVLKQVAGITDGKYYRVTDRGAFAAINSDIKKMEDNKTKAKKNVQYEENYTLFLYWGIIFFILSHLIPVRAVNIRLDFIKRLIKR